MRLYLGSVNYASVNGQQRFFNRARRAAEAVAGRHGFTVADAWDQLAREARRQGLTRPVPGQHM